MKHTYTTPAITVINISTVTMLASSPANEYSDNQGFIRFGSTEVSANDAD